MLHSRMLRYLDEVARNGSIRKAAGKLNVASSAVNRQILALEQEIGTPIFERLRKRLRLTATGELLIAHVRQTLKEHDRVRARIEDLKGLRRGEVTIATMGGLAASLLTPLVVEFRRNHPGVKIQVRVLSSGEIINAVSSGEADLGFAFDLPRDPVLQSVATLDCRIGAVVPPGHPLADQLAVTIGTCLDYPLLLAGAGMTLRSVLDDAFARSGIAVEPILESNSIEMLKRAATLGLGVAFLNVIDVLDERRRGALVFLPLSDRHLKPQILRVVRRAKGGLDMLPSLMAEELKGDLESLANEVR
jgi:DNA-binding transcriptional LysR family regulator